MDLKSFIKQSIVDIVSAMEESRKELDRKIKFPVAKENQNVQFDIAVTVEDSETANGGIQIFKIAQAGVNNESKNATSSRISFSLFIESL